MMTGCPGVFAGGDMVPAERTVTVGVGHGKKAARFIDAYLSGGAAALAARTRSGRASTGCTRGISPTPSAGTSPSARPAAGSPTSPRWSAACRRTRRYEASRCLSCGNCFECDGCFGSCPEDAIIKIRPSRPWGHEHGADYAYVFDYDRCTGCGICHEQCPVNAIEMIPEEP